MKVGVCLLECRQQTLLHVILLCVVQWVLIAGHHLKYIECYSNILCDSKVATLIWVELNKYCIVHIHLTLVC